MDMIVLSLSRALGMSTIVKVPVPRSEAFGIWISADTISGLRLAAGV